MGQQMEFYLFSFSFLSLQMCFRLFSLLIKILLTCNKWGLVSFYLFLSPAISIHSHKLSWKNPSAGDTHIWEKSAVLENWLKNSTFFARFRFFSFRNCIDKRDWKPLPLSLDANRVRNNGKLPAAFHGLWMKPLAASLSYLCLCQQEGQLLPLSPIHVSITITALCPDCKAIHYFLLSIYLQKWQQVSCNGKVEWALNLSGRYN